jgi:glutamate dehydrogenase/leucine dehydrogenase
LNGKKAIIQGWGNVASAAAFYLAQKGVKIVGIIDIAGGLINEEGFSFEEISQLFINKKGNNLNSDRMMSFDEANARIWDLKADIFIPGAASKIINRDQVDRMIKSGLELISCGANVPFVDDDVFFGPTARYTDEKISIIPDFIANCGMARVFAYLMQKDVEVTDEAIFNDCSNTIHQALRLLKDKNNSKLLLSTTGLGIALEKLMSK